MSIYKTVFDKQVANKFFFWEDSFFLLYHKLFTVLSFSIHKNYWFFFRIISIVFSFNWSVFIEMRQAALNNLMQASAGAYSKNGLFLSLGIT